MLSKSQGFTLVEAVIVLAIIVILAINFNPFWQGTGIGLVTQANELANDIRYTQALAMSKGQRFRLVLTSGNTYRILNATGGAVMLSNGTTTSTLDSNTSFSSIVNLPNSLIAFNTQGAPYIDTAIPGTALTATASITLSQGGLSRTVIISAGTGRVATQ